MKNSGGERGGRQTSVANLGTTLDFLGPIGFVAANLAANWPQAALVKRDLNPAKTDL